jgi:hypothetical protein
MAGSIIIGEGTNLYFIAYQDDAKTNFCFYGGCGGDSQVSVRSATNTYVNKVDWEIELDRLEVTRPYVDPFEPIEAPLP